MLVADAARRRWLVAADEDEGSSSLIEFAIGSSSFTAAAASSSLIAAIDEPLAPIDVGSFGESGGGSPARRRERLRGETIGEKSWARSVQETIRGTYRIDVRYLLHLTAERVKSLSETRTDEGEHEPCGYEAIKNDDLAIVNY